jgi:hypothetical protein
MVSHVFHLGPLERKRVFAATYQTFAFVIFRYCPLPSTYLWGDLASPLGRKLATKAGMRCSRTLQLLANSCVADLLRPMTPWSLNTVLNLIMITVSELPILYDFPINVYNHLSIEMNMFEQTLTNKSIDHGILAHIEDTVRKIHNIRIILWVLQHYVYVLVDIPDILLQKKMRNEELLHQNPIPTPGLTERITPTRIAFETRLDGIYRTQLEEISRLNSAEVDEVEEGSHITLGHMDAYAVLAKDRLVCISTFSARLEAMLTEEDEGMVVATKRVMKIRLPEVYDAFGNWMSAFGARGSDNGERDPDDLVD